MSARPKKGDIIMSGKHFTIDERYTILEGVKNNLSIRSIAKNVNSSPSTVSRELEKHRELDTPGAFKTTVPTCTRVTSAPWICNGCKKISACKKRKYKYNPKYAQQTYERTLHDSRQKIRTGSIGLSHIDHIITPLIRDKGQSLAHVYATHADELGISRSTCYRYIDNNLLTVRNSDLPARVRYPKHIKKKKRGDNSGIENHKCRENRDYVAFQAFISEHPKRRVVEMDSVIGAKGEHKVLLTLHFRKSNFMLAFLRDSNDAQSVVDIFDAIQKKIGYSDFVTLFNVVLTDNGSEFKLADELEHGKRNSKRCNLFYCDARSSQQKAKVETNHRFIRRYLPQGVSFDHLTQKDINLMMSYINSVKRDYLDERSPFECLTQRELRVVKMLGLKPIEPDDVILKPSIFNK